MWLWLLLFFLRLKPQQRIGIFLALFLYPIELSLPVLFHFSASLCRHFHGVHFLSCSHFNSKCYKPVGNRFPQNISGTRLREVTPWARSRSGLNLCQSETSCQPRPRYPTGKRLSHQSRPRPLLAVPQERGSKSIHGCHITSPWQGNNLVQCRCCDRY